MGSERELRNGALAARCTADPGYRVPGYPQDMMDMHGMHTDADLQRINQPLTRGMRAKWYAGVEGLMTVLRVLPSELYDRVISGDGDVPPGSSVPGAGHEAHEHRL
jgi:hypothetical protein